MAKPCPDCGTRLLPADNMDCQKASFVCPTCAPEFVLMRATSYSDVVDETDEWSDNY